MLKVIETSFLILILALNLPAQQRIVLKPEQIINVQGQGRADFLIDENKLVGDPAKGSSFEPLTAFDPGYNKLYNPASVIIQLDGKYALDELWLYDSNGSDTITVFTGYPGQWKLQGKIVTNSYRKWRSFSIRDSSELLLLKFRWPQAKINEIVLYGTKLSPSTIKSPHLGKRPPQKSLAELMGVNGFIDDPVDLLVPVGATVREYHRWQWDEGDVDRTYLTVDGRKFAWNPSYAGNWNFDNYYRMLHERGVQLAPCLHTHAAFHRGLRHADSKPVIMGANSESPQAYIDHSEYLFQFAARYGSANVNRDKLSLRVDQEYKSGLGYVQYVENWNEPDKWWRGPDGYFNPFEFAAMCSADYDGHEGTLGEKCGLKSADSSMRMVMGGLTGLHTDYVRAMLLWSQYNRKTGFPADVLNFHHYSNNAGGQRGKASQAISPEEDNLKSKLKALTRFRDKWLPGKEIWLSEFGYDTNPQSPQGVPKIQGLSSQEVQAQWLVRSFLEIAASGIDRAQVFMLRDVNHENPNKYNSSGLTGEKWTQHERKLAWFYLAAVRELGKGVYFDREINSGHEAVRIYSFKGKDGQRLCAIWCPTSSNHQELNFQLPFALNNSARLIKLSPTKPYTRELSLSSGKPQIDVSETPLFIKLSNGVN